MFDVGYCRFILFYIIYRDSNSDGLLRLISCGLTDATYVLRIMCDLNVIPLALQITNICGNVMVSHEIVNISLVSSVLVLDAFKRSCSALMSHLMTLFKRSFAYVMHN